jgi:hypothetical protein
MGEENELRNLTSMGVNRLQPAPATPPDNKKKGQSPRHHSARRPHRCRVHPPTLTLLRKYNFSSSFASSMAHKKIKILVELTVMLYCFVVKMAMKIS